MQQSIRKSHRAAGLAWRAILIGLLSTAVTATLAHTASAAKNVIIMVADGAGFNTWRATSMYQGKLGKQVFDGPEWVKLAVCTHPLNQSRKPLGTNVQEPGLVYDPAKAWSAAAAIETVPLLAADKEEKKEEKMGAAPGKAAPQKPAPTRQVQTFAGYVWLKKTYTDSAAAATALASGVKTYNNAINWSDDDRPLTGLTLAEIARGAGKSVGVVTSVQVSHATPAAFAGAHNVSRNDYKGIANEMFKAPYLDVIMGAGHPEFNDNGLPRDLKRDYRYVGGEETWASLRSGTHPGAWKLVETKADFEALAQGPTPAKVLGVAQVATTLQQKRGKPEEKLPFTCPFNPNVPTLATLARAALNCLDDNPRGFYLMIEGGAVDWANHSRKLSRAIEEQIDFLEAVETIIQWINAHSSWDQTLLILTADHETGLIWGPDSDASPYQPIVDGGPRNLPAVKYNHTAHTNALVPLFARGPGAERFNRLAVGTDETAAARWEFSGRYIDSTGIYSVARQECLGKPLPGCEKGSFRGKAPDNGAFEVR